MVNVKPTKIATIRELHRWVPAVVAVEIVPVAVAMAVEAETLMMMTMPTQVRITLYLLIAMFRHASGNLTTGI
jgi:hypothetical protein